MIVIEYVPGGVPGCDVVIELLPTPHATRAPASVRATSSPAAGNAPRTRPLCHPRACQPATPTAKIQSAQISQAGQSRKGPSGSKGRGSSSEAAVVDKVTVEVAALDSGVSEGCENEHVERLGKSEQASVTGLE